MYAYIFVCVCVCGATGTAIPNLPLLQCVCVCNISCMHVCMYMCLSSIGPWGSRGDACLPAGGPLCAQSLLICSIPGVVVVLVHGVDDDDDDDDDVDDDDGSWPRGCVLRSSIGRSKRAGPSLVLTQSVLRPL